MITKKEAQKIAPELYATNNTLTLHASVVDGRIVFTGGQYGEHSLSLAASTKERILDHWKGYCQANGVAVRSSRTQQKLAEMYNKYTTDFVRRWKSAKTREDRLHYAHEIVSAASIVARYAQKPFVGQIFAIETFDANKVAASRVSRIGPRGKVYTRTIYRTRDDGAEG